MDVVERADGVSKRARLGVHEAVRLCHLARILPTWMGGLTGAADGGGHEGQGRGGEGSKHDGAHI
jgi:hypothetical protein